MKRYETTDGWNWTEAGQNCLKKYIIISMLSIVKSGILSCPKSFNGTSGCSL
jgi:hypothetical protein